MRRIIAFMLLFACLVSLFVVYTAAADADGSTDAGNPEGEYRRVNLTETSVMEDLKAVEEKQKGQTGGFKISNYPAIPFSKKIEFLALTEDFRLDTDAKRHYGLYLYLYNPGRITIEMNEPHLQNALQMSVAGFNMGHFAKYPLQLVSYSEDKLFYKFLVKVPADFERLISTTQRVYSISGIEIVARYDGNTSTVHDHMSKAMEGGISAQTIKIVYTEHTPSTCKEITGDDLLHLDIGMAYYDVSAGADTHKANRLATAWFLLPKKYLDDDGKTDLKYINYVCEKISDLNVMTTNYTDSNLFVKEDYAVGGSASHSVKVLKPSTFKFIWRFCITSTVFNRPISWSNQYYVWSTYPLSETERNNLARDQFDINGTYISKKDYGSYTNTLLGDTVIDVVIPSSYGSKPNSANLFELFDDSAYIYKYKYYGIKEKNIGGNIDVLNPENYYNTISYKEATNNFSGFFQRVKDLGGLKEAVDSFWHPETLSDDSLKDLNLFTVVDPADKSLSDQDFSYKYKLDISTVQTIKRQFDSFDKNGYYVALFRFDISEYTAFDNCGKLPNNSVVSKGNTRFLYDYFYHCYNDITHMDGEIKYPSVYKMTAYRNFDILDLTFTTPEGFRIVPVNADPVKFFAGDIKDADDLKPDYTPPSSSWPTWGIGSLFKDYAPAIIAGIVLIVAVALIVPLSRASGTVYNGVSKAGKSVVAGVKKLDQKIRRKKKKK